MAATIRLSRHGGKKSPFYRIVVADKNAPRDGRRLDQVGVYDPRQKPSRVEFVEDRLVAWLNRGARPSATVAQLMKKCGIPRAAQPVAGEPS